MSRLQSYSVVLIAILLGFFLRLHNLDLVPLRGDEAFSAFNWAQMPINQSLAEIAIIEPHPPLTYVIFHIWNLIIGGIDSPFALRMLSVLGNVIGIPALYALGVRLLGKHRRDVAVILAFMFAVHPFEVWHSQDFRNYALWAGLSVTTLWLGLRLNPYRPNRPIDWVLYGTFATVTAFTFYTELLLIGALGFYMLFIYYRQRDFLVRFLGLQAAIVIAVMVGFVILQGNLFGGGGYGGNVEAFSPPDYLTRFVPVLTLGETIPVELADLWIPLCIILVLGFALLFYLQCSIAMFPFLLITIPLALLGIASMRISIFHPRYVLAAVPAFLLVFVMIGYTIASYISKFVPLPRMLLTVIFVSPWFVISALTLHNYYTDYQTNPALRKAPAWDELGEFLNANVTEDDFVIQLSVDPAFGYYYDGEVDETALPASSNQSADDIVTILENLQADYDSIYIVSNAISGWQNADVVENWANDNMQLVRLSNASGLGIRQYKSWTVTDVDKADILVEFEDTIELIGYRLFDEPLPTGELVLWLYWRPLSRRDTSLKSFVHLAGNTNPTTGSPLWSQDDQFPQEGRLDSATWETGQIYRDVYYLPADDLDNGTYQILVGWYVPETNSRLTTSTDADSYPLKLFTYP